MFNREKKGDLQIRIAHSPDADDRFMFWPLRAGKIPSRGFSFTWEEADTQSLNHLANTGGPDVCAISVFHYGRVWQSYQPLKMGCSVGNAYGPVVVARHGVFDSLGSNQGEAFDAESLLKETPAAFRHLAGKPPTVLLTPGESTTAHNVTQLLGLQGFATETVPIVPIERIFQRLEALEAEGRPALALLIHEGRLLFSQYGCERLLDIGLEWRMREHSSLPLGMNVIHRRLSAEVRRALSGLFIESCLWAQSHRDAFFKEAADPHSPFHTRLSRDELSAYLDLYANETTRSVTPEDAQAFASLLSRAQSEGLLSPTPPIPCDWI
jgi:1,4-dihydroxy-6-naphthoate synthase